jgi:rfaE bifunctional protein nucleotidyltransferase chain/domain
MSSKILEERSLIEKAEEIRRNLPQKKIVLCHGVFDLVHPGHLNHFKQARSLGDILIVSITSDRFVNKGPNRPFFSQDYRAEFLSSIEIIDYVVVSDYESSKEIIEKLKPDVYVKGEEYEQFDKDETGKIIEEKQVVESVGGVIEFTRGFHSSSTYLINRSNLLLNSEKSKWISDLRLRFSIEEIFSYLENLRSINPIVLGESILDSYTDCTPLGKASKYPLLAFQKGETRNFPGGTSMIADSCASLSGQSQLVLVLPETAREAEDMFRNAGPGINPIVFHDNSSKVIEKQRFIDLGSGLRVFEIYDYDPQHFQDETYEKIEHAVQRSNGPVIIADYGHGFFSSRLIANLVSISSFISVNTQMNAGNRGFNTISKYGRADLISLNGGELELEFKTKDLDYPRVVPIIMDKMKSCFAVVTLGSKGLLVFDDSGNYSHTPALGEKIIDKVGAGDAVFAAASMLAFQNAPIEIIGLVASICAAREVSSLGHKSAMNLVDLKKHIKGLLG